LYERGIAAAPKTWIKRSAHWKMNGSLAWAEAGNLDSARKLYQDAKAAEPKLGDSGKKKLAKVGKILDDKSKAAEKPADKPAEAGGADDSKKPEAKQQALDEGKSRLRVAGAAIVQLAAV
jgi:hypothetical protein